MAVVVPNVAQNGRFIDGIDVTDPDYIREIQRPPAIKEDVKLMEQRRRVSVILRSPHFKKELEKIVASSLKCGYLNANILALKQIIEYITPQTRIGSSNFTKGITVPVVPINDLRNVDHRHYVKGERLVRCKLVSIYRLVDIHGWNVGINSHITARVTRDGSEFLIKPTGLLFNELTASSLLKVNLDGTIIDQGTTNFGFDKNSWILHSILYSIRSDVRCIVHLSSPAAVAVSSSKNGLLPISQEAMILGETAFYDQLLSGDDFNGNGNVDTLADRFDKKRNEIATIFSQKSADCMLLLVRSYGLFAMGQSIEDAWFTAYNAMLACEAQLRLANVNADEIILPSKDAQETAHNVGRNPALVQLKPGETVGSSGWGRGELEFEADMRKLDAAGYCTGYIYRLSQIRYTTTSTLQRTRTGTMDSSIAEECAMSSREAAAYVRRTTSLGRGLRGLKDVEIPPTVSSFATSYYGDEESRLLASEQIKAKTMSLSRTHWLNTPNAYTREEIEEIGTSNPQKFTCWKEGTLENKSHTGGVSLLIDNPNQFAYQGEDPTEFKTHQKRVKDRYYKDFKSAGPKSRILEGLDLEDDMAISQPVGSSQVCSPRGTLLRLDPSNPPSLEPGHVVVVGAASKGIINRSHRFNPGVYQSVYSPNPFDRMTDDDLARYKENVERKAKGLPSLEEEEARAQMEEARIAAELAKQVTEGVHLLGDVKRETLGISQIRSDTSGADVSHDDADFKKDAEKKKKRRFKIPYFARKSKSKETKEKQ